MSELQMYINNQEALLAQYNGKIIALHGGEVIGEYPGKLDALNDMKARGMAPGSFLIVKCTPGDSEYTRKFRSRVLETLVVMCLWAWM